MRVRLRSGHRRVFVKVAAVSGVLLPVLLSAQTAAATVARGAYQQTNLVSDQPGVARHQDSHLVNPWGLSSGPTTPFWASDNGAGVSTLYDGTGQPFPAAAPLVVRIPPPPGSPEGTNSTPTGTVFNSTTDFVITKGGSTGPSRFLFATEDGTIAAWKIDSDPNNAIITIDKSASGAVYKGLTLGSTASGNFLYAANFHDATIDVFDKDFHQVALAGSFTDPNLPAGYAPFNVQNLNGLLYVTYALQDAERQDDVAGAGHGFVDIYDTSGHLLRRFASGGTLNSPWGLAIAPAGFGAFNRNVLVGNFGDGHINGFDRTTARFRGQLGDGSGHPIAIEGLWALRFGNAGPNFDSNTLYFTAGPDDETHGLFGSLKPAED